MNRLRRITSGFLIVAALLSFPACKNKEQQDPNAVVGYDGMTPLHRAAVAGDTATLEQLLSVERANPDMRDIAGVAPIHYAARAGYLDAVKMLVSYGADPTDKTSTGWSAVALAIRENHVDVVNFLSQYNFDVDGSTPDGEQYLAYAVRIDSTPLVEWLLEHRADPNIDMGGGFTPLEMYFQRGNHDNVLLLLNNGASLKRTRPGNGSPLHMAIEWKDVFLLNRLLGAGADPWVTDFDSRTARQHAEDNGLTDMADILAAAEATHPR